MLTNFCEKSIQKLAGYFSVAKKEGRRMGVLNRPLMRRQNYEGMLAPSTVSATGRVIKGVRHLWF